MFLFSTKSVSILCGLLLIAFIVTSIVLFLQREKSDKDAKDLQDRISKLEENIKKNRMQRRLIYPPRPVGRLPPNYRPPEPKSTIRPPPESDEWTYDTDFPPRPPVPRPPSAITLFTRTTPEPSTEQTETSAEDAETTTLAATAEDAETTTLATEAEDAETTTLATEAEDAETTTLAADEESAEPSASES